MELLEEESCLKEMSFLVEMFFSIGGLALLVVLLNDDEAIDLLFLELKDVALLFPRPFEDWVILLFAEAC